MDEQKIQKKGKHVYYVCEKKSALVDAIVNGKDTKPLVGKPFELDKSKDLTPREAYKKYVNKRGR